MSYPANLDTIVVRHKIVDTGGKPLKGNSVRAVATKRIWATDGSLIPFETTARVQADGSYEFELPYVDQPGIHNKGVPFQVIEDVPGKPRHYFIAPVLAHGAGPIDATEALVEAPVGYEVKIQAGPVTDAAAASLLDQDGQFKAALTGTIETAAVAPARSAAIDVLAEQPEVAQEAATRAVSVAADPAIAGAIGNASSDTRTALDAHYTRAHTIDSTKYGASSAATWTVNRDAINAAIDDAYAVGGGVVLLPPGNVTVKGIVQRSSVDLRFQGTTLVHPDGNSGSIITTETIVTTGSIAKDSNILTVADATNIHPGAVVAVAGAGGRNEAAIWTITAAISSSQTTGITLDGTNGLFAGGGLLLVDGELIGYTGLSGTTLTGVTRGALGTTPAGHASGAWISQAVRLYAQIEAKDENTLTLATHALVGVTGAAVDAGPAYPAISGGARFYGNRPSGGAAATWYPVDWTGVGGGEIDSITAERCEAALMLGRGTTATQVGTVTAHDCGNAPVKGSAVWMFRGASGNAIGSITATGPDTYTGLYIDDRTSTASEYDGPCMDNTVGSVTVRRPFKGTTSPSDGIGVNITGSGRNIINSLNVDGIRFPIVIAGQSQNQRPDGSVNPWTYGNVVNGGALTNCHRPWSVTAPGNLLSGIYWHSVQGLLGDSAAPVTLVGVSEVSGGPPTLTVRFADGSRTAPSITFANDPDSGFYRVGDGDFALSSNGQWVFRIRPNDVMLNDGMNIQVGTGTGTRIGAASTQKLGFFGQTPVTRRTGLGTIPEDAPLSTVIAKMNAAFIGLRELGLFDA